MVNPVKPSLRKVLADSYIAAVAIVTLLLGFIDSVAWFLWPFIKQASEYVITAILIFDLPYFEIRALLFNSALLLFFAVAAITSLIAAWLIAKWAYGCGPLESLMRCREQLMGRRNV